MEKPLRSLHVLVEQGIMVIPHGHILVSAGVVLRPQGCQVVSAGVDLSDGAVGLTWISVTMNTDYMVRNFAVALFINSVQKNEQQVETRQERVLKQFKINFLSVAQFWETTKQHMKVETRQE